MRKFWQHRTIAHKLLYSSLAFAIPIALLLFFMISGTWQQIRFTELEIKGSELGKPLAELTGYIQGYQHLYFFYIRGQTKKEEMKELAGKIDEVWGQFFVIYEKTKSDLQVDEKGLLRAKLERVAPEKLRAQWEKIVEKLVGGKASMFDTTGTELELLLDGLQALNVRIAQTANLIHDPDMDTYYLIDLTNNLMPKSQIILGEILHSGQRAIALTKLDKRNIINLGIILNNLEKVLDQVQHATLNFLREDENYQYFDDNEAMQYELLQAKNQYVKTVNKVQQVVSPLFRTGEFKGSPDEFLDSVKQALTAGIGVWETSGRAMKKCLESRKQYQIIKMITAISICALAIMAAALMVFKISRGISRSLQHVTFIAGEIAEGRVRQALDELGPDASVERIEPGAVETVDKGDEIRRLARAIRSMTEHLQSLLTQVQHSGIQVTSTATDIAAAARQLESTVTEQAATTDQVSISTREISHRSRELAGTVDEVTDTVVETADLADQVLSGLTDMEQTLGKLVATTAFISDQLTAIRGNTENITEVVTTITKVADQTNLLSLNASIEAEKAGQYGFGFSVVAREISRLADQTAVSALDIEETVAQMQAAVSSGVAEIDYFIREVRQSVDRTSDIGSQMTTIIGRVSDLLPRFEAVNEAVKAQRDGAGEISQAVTGLSEGAQQTKDSLMEFNRATSMLTDAVQGLRKEVSRFEIG